MAGRVVGLAVAAHSAAAHPVAERSVVAGVAVVPKAGGTAGTDARTGWIAASVGHLALDRSWIGC